MTDQLPTEEQKKIIKDLFWGHVDEIRETTRVEINNELNLMHRYNNKLYREYEAIGAARKTMIETMETLIDYHEQFLMVINEMMGIEDNKEKLAIVQKIKDARKKRIMLYQLYLAPSLVNALTKEEIFTLGDLANKTVKELKLIKGIGPKNIELLRERLRSNGLSLRTPYDKDMDSE